MLKHICLLLILGILALAADQIPLPSKNDRHNIVFILTDDQDKHMDSLEYMPLLKKHITDRGTFYNRHYCSTAIWYVCFAFLLVQVFQAT